MADDPSIDNEPQYQERSFHTDPSERRAAERLARERCSDGSDGGGDGLHSVYNEPAVLPGQDGRCIDRDWSCRNCGYNLRNLQTGRPCPECGVVEVYHPPPERAESYAAWLVDRRTGVTPGSTTLALSLAAVAAAPFAILGALMSVPGVAWMSSVVAMPTLEEVLKVAALYWLIEARQYLIRSRYHIFLVAGLGALIFAIVQNVVFLSVYASGATPFVVAWRWTACPALHVGCSLVAAGGLARVWSRSARELRPPSLSAALPALVGAIVIHGAYNAAVTVLQWPGLQC